MHGKIAAAAAGGAALLVLAFITIAGGGSVATANAPAGGCAVTAGTGTGPKGPGTTSGNQKSATLDAAQMAIARTIAGVGKGMQIGERGIAIALATAMQESTLDPGAVKGRSVGLFQQQGEFYAHVNRTDPADTTRAFYAMLLKRVPDYHDPAAGTLADIAQTVQASGAGAGKYADWESWATGLAKQLVTGTPAEGGTEGTGSGNGTDVVCKVGGGSGPVRASVNGLTIGLPAQAGVTGTITFPGPQAATAAAAALSYLGTPYAWGGGTAAGPSKGIRDGGVADAHGDYTKTGFDCSGLMLYAYSTAGITLPRTARVQQQAGNKLPYTAAQPGDLLFYGRPAHHVTMYLGTLPSLAGTGGGVGYQLEAPNSGDVVKVSPVRTGGDFQPTAVRPY